MMLARLLTRFRGPVREITADALAAELEAASPPVLIDIRSTEQFTAGHLPGAVHIPAARLPAAAAGLNRSAPTVIY